SSSAASAANAVVDTVRSIVEPTPAGDWHSVCICSDGSYSVEKGLISSFPVRSNGQKLEIVQGLPINEFSRSKIDATLSELKEERTLVSELLPKKSDVFLAKQAEYLFVSRVCSVKRWVHLKKN